MAPPLSPSAFLPAQRRAVSERVREFPPPTIYRLPARRNDLGMYWLERRGLTSRTLGAAAAAGRRRRCTLQPGDGALADTQALLLGNPGRHRNHQLARRAGGTEVGLRVALELDAIVLEHP